jgi:hypothetical protein
MKETTMKRVILAMVFWFVGFSAASQTLAQDYIGQVAAIQRQLQQEADMHARQAVQSYRQQTGDYSNSDQAILEYLVAESRRQNPAWYADLQQREANFQAQQAAYTQYAHGMLDQSFNSYMQRSQWQHEAHQNYMRQSNRQHQGHQDYIRQGIWGNELYQGADGSVYELPYYAGGNRYQSHDGSTFWQDQSGQYYQYDSAGWGYNLSPFGW